MFTTLTSSQSKHITITPIKTTNKHEVWKPYKIMKKWEIEEGFIENNSHRPIQGPCKYSCNYMNNKIKSKPKPKLECKLNPKLSVATLAFGLWPRQGFARLRAKREAQESYHMFPGVQRVWGMNPHTPKWTPIVGVGLPMDSQIFKAQL